MLSPASLLSMVAGSMGWILLLQPPVEALHDRIHGRRSLLVPLRSVLIQKPQRTEACLEGGESRILYTAQLNTQTLIRAAAQD